MVHPMLSSVLYLTGANAAPKRLGEPDACSWAAFGPSVGWHKRFLCSHKESRTHNGKGCLLARLQARPSLWISSTTTGWAAPSLTPRSAAS